jgi:hypothetical protein
MGRPRPACNSINVIMLQPGGSMHLPSSMPHRYANPTGDTTRAVTVILYGCPAPAGPACPPVP